MPFWARAPASEPEMTAIVTIVVTFILTGVIGNWLVQRWQHNNWLRQHRFLGVAKDQESLRQIFEEISQSAGARLWQMFRLVKGIGRFEEQELRSRVSEYEKALSQWNEKLNIFYAKLTLYSKYDYTSRLEWDIQARFVENGVRIERLVRKRLDGHAIRSQDIVAALDGLNALQAIIFNFNRDLLRIVQAQQEIAYYGVRVKFSHDTLDLFPTWQLFKALFVSRIESLSVVRSPSDLDKPIVGWESWLRIHKHGGQKG
jgi:hypothetical protein